MNEERIEWDKRIGLPDGITLDKDKTKVKEISSKPVVKCGLPYHKCDDCGTEYYSNERCPECSPMG